MDCKAEYCWCGVEDTICWPEETKLGGSTDPICTAGEGGSGRCGGRLSGCAIGRTGLVAVC